MDVLLANPGRSGRGNDNITAGIRADGVGAFIEPLQANLRKVAVWSKQSFEAPGPPVQYRAVGPAKGPSIRLDPADPGQRVRDDLLLKLDLGRIIEMLDRAAAARVLEASARHAGDAEKLSAEIRHAAELALTRQPSVSPLPTTPKRPLRV